MKRAILVLVAIAFIGFCMVPDSWAGPAEETGRQLVEQAMLDYPGFFVGVNPEVVAWYYLDLMSNFGGWQSFLVITNWDLERRIRILTRFIPTDGTPSDIVSAEHYIGPNAVAYLTSRDLGFSAWGQTNWFGYAIADTATYWGCGVLLYHSEYGLTWIKGDGPYF
jgi:hypothetical protein